MKTALYDRHVELGARMAPFAEWEMPLYYAGILPEHAAVRQHAGVFDVSHMGMIAVEGPGAEGLLDYLSTNRIAGKTAGSATYTVWCDAQGSCVDDLIVFKISSERFFVVANAANRHKDLALLQKYARGVTIIPRFDTHGILAVQGPQAQVLFSELISAAQHVPPHHCIENGPMVISGTGYTSAGGVEVFAPNELLGSLWDELLKKGVSPVGLGARDLLRLEMGYALYGHELSPVISPLESVSAWTIHWEKEIFLGKQALLNLQQSGKARVQQGLVLDERGLAREGCAVYKEGQKLGVVTSGNFSPTLQRGIALAILQERLPEGSKVDVEIRQQFHPAKIAPVPFIVGNR